jgi:hypothetical protein
MKTVTVRPNTGYGRVIMIETQRETNIQKAANQIKKGQKNVSK